MALFDPDIWQAVPFHFWSVVLFTFGSMVGSFLNVCIYRMPREESVVSPPSHCPHCGYAIPFYLNIPLVTWVYLRAKCANCRAPISGRYFLVELLTALVFLGCWLRLGETAPGVALVYCLVLAGFIVATFIDFEHFIIPDAITLGGVAAGFICSFLVPGLHQRTSAQAALLDSFWGIVIGGGLLYAVVRGGKLLFGKKKVDLAPDTRLVFTEEYLVLPEEQVRFEDIFYRPSDRIEFRAKFLELPDRCYRDVEVKLSPETLYIGADKLNPETVPHLEAVTDKLVLPQEAMGLGDVKFMAAIGAFLGWPGVLFSLTASAIIGSVVGVTLILLKRQEWSSRLPYGPYIALAATLWMFLGNVIVRLLFPA